jgi:hypothetical protein
MSLLPSAHQVEALDARLRRFIAMPYGEREEIRRVFEAYIQLLETVPDKALIETIETLITQRDLLTAENTQLKTRLLELEA